MRRENRAILVDEGLSTRSICRYVVYLIFTFVQVHVFCVRITSQRSLFGVMDFFSSSEWYPRTAFRGQRIIDNGSKKSDEQALVLSRIYFLPKIAARAPCFLAFAASVNASHVVPELPPSSNNKTFVIVYQLFHDSRSQVRNLRKVCFLWMPARRRTTVRNETIEIWDLPTTLLTV